MSTGGLAVPPARVDRERTQRSRVWELLARRSPSQGWATFALLAALLLVVGLSLTEADWVDTPGLFNVLIWSAAAGLLLAKVRAPAPLLHGVGLALGFVVVVWQTASLIEDMAPSEQLRELWDRLSDWYEAASTGGINTDTIAITLVFLTLAWLMGYVSSWFVFRSNNVWVGVVLTGIAILTNLSFLPDKFSSRFFLFLLLAMLLVARMSIVERHDVWRKASVQFSTVTGWFAMHSTAWFVVLVLLLAAFLPMKIVKSQTAASIWTAGRAPVARMEDNLTRLLAGVSARKDLYGRFFGNTLPFLGRVSLNGGAVFWANTDYPSYWLSQIYSEYTSRGWIAGETRALKVGPDTLPPPRSDSLKRVPVQQSLRLSFSTPDFLSGGSVDWVSHDAVVHSLTPKEFKIDLVDSGNNSMLPDDIQELARTLTRMVESLPGEYIESEISRILPRDLVLIRYIIADEQHPELPGITALTDVTVARKEPMTPEISSWKFEESLLANGTYGMVSFVSVATDDDLRGADPDYSGFIKDHYLQLPPSLPERVLDLAKRVTAKAETPLDKAVAIQEILRGPNFEYSEDLRAPGRDADGVDHFLFSTQKGYSDYFASSMAVMLRAVGVPARLAAGYAPGEYDADAEFTAVKDSDSHVWVQVFFPKYGWIDFEPTPNWPVHQRRMFTVAVADSEREGVGAFGLDQEIGEFLDPNEDEDIVPESDEFVEFNDSWKPTSQAIPLAIALGSIAAVWLGVRFVWSLGLSNATPVEKSYTKMNRLGALGGVRRQANQTPMEYAATLGNAIPAVASGAHTIALAFTHNRYGGEHSPGEDERRIEQTWRRVRSSLIARTFSRLVPVKSKTRR